MEFELLQEKYPNMILKPHPFTKYWRFIYKMGPLGKFIVKKLAPVIGG